MLLTGQWTNGCQNKEYLVLAPEKMLIVNCKCSQLLSLSEEGKKKQNIEKPVQLLIFLVLWLLPCGSADPCSELDETEEF